MTRRDYRAEMDRMLELHGGLYTYEDIMDCIRDGKMQSFADGDTWLITQVNEFPRKKVLELVFVVGDFDTAEKLLNGDVERFRKEIQADMTMATGRLGWLGKKRDGWKAISANFIKVH